MAAPKASKVSNTAKKARPVNRRTQRPAPAKSVRASGSKKRY